jgi:SpoVK/Ycf46/Vps4 family AAA+-type ATPase
MHSAPSRVTSEAVSEQSAASPFISGSQHLLAELDWLRLVLERHVLRLRARGLMVENDFRGLFLSDDHIDAVLRDSESVQAQTSTLDRAILHQRELIALRLQYALNLGLTLPLDRITQTFDLSLFERQVLIACAAAEIDLGFESLYAYVQNDVNRKWPTADLLLRLFSSSALDRIALRDSLSQQGALIRNRLAIFADDSQGRAQHSPARALALDEHILDFLLDHSGPDRRLRSFASLLAPRSALGDLLLPEPLITQLMRAVHSTFPPPLILLYGPAGSGKRTTVEAVSHAMEQHLLVADLRAAISQPLTLDEYLPLLQRDAALHRATLFLAHAESLEPDARRRLLYLLGSSQTQGNTDLYQPLTFLGSTPPDSSAMHSATPADSLSFTLPVPSYQSRIDLWHTALDRTGLALLAADVASLSSRFSLTGGEINGACVEAARTLELRHPDLQDPDLHHPQHAALTMPVLTAAIGNQSSHALHQLAQKVESVHTWSDLILPRRAMQQLRDVCSSAKFRHVVYSEWGFDRKLAMGKGLNVLFCGPSGTGKTMAAGILAVELGLDIYKIDLSTVISKYIGETEKQLSLIFKEARSSNAILFFDEADALFGKRSEVKDAHDRYANVETAYLLQKIEEYEGIVVLTTNLRKNIDDAFARRMHHVIEFSFPDAAQRLLIWTNLLPAAAHCDPDIDFGFLARQFDLSGGAIRNIALAAAFLAAEQQSSIRMEHFILATAREIIKLGRIPSRSEFREYFDLIHAQF